MASTNNFYGSSTTNRTTAPRPPPKPAGTATTTATARRTASTTASSKIAPKPASTTARRTAAAPRPKPKAASAYQSSRSVPSSRTTTAGSTVNANANPSTSKTTTAMRSRNNASSSSSIRSSSGAAMNMNMNMKNPSTGAKKAPVVKRPVGSYYNSTPATTSSESTNVNSGASNNNYLYASSSVPAATSTAGTTATSTDTTENDTWDDWGSPAAKTTANPHSSWAAPAASNVPAAAAAPVAAATTNDWYSAGGSATATATATATTAPVAPGYTSSGFGNQPSSHQQQQTPIQPGSGFYPSNATQQQQQQQQPFLSGSMDSSAPTMSAVNPNSMNPGMTNADNGNASASSRMPSFSMFMPSAVMQQQGGGVANNDPYDPSIEDEAPLLEELGINIQHMVLKTKAVVFPFSRLGGDQIDPAVICQDGDLPGPVALLLLLGGEMVMAGKLQFGYIYIYGLFGCLAMTLVVNLISPADAVSFWTVMSIMGYALLPVNILGLIKIFVMNLFNLQTLGTILGALTILWSTMASTRLLELGCGLRDQRYLIMYPLLLFYSAFVMMTIL